MAFKHQADEGYVISAASNIVVKLKIDPLTGAATVQSDPSDTTRVLQIPTGKNPRGIVVSTSDKTAYVMNYVSRSVSVIAFYPWLLLPMLPVILVIITANDRVELARPRLGGQVAAVLLERSVGPLGVRRRDALAATHALERLQDRLATRRVALEQRLGLAADLGDGEQEVLGRHVLVTEPLGLGLGELDGAPGARVHRERAALDPGAPGEDRRELAAEPGQVDAEPAQGLGRDPVIGLDQRREDVLGIEDRAVEALGCRLGGDDRLLGLLGEAFELHG
jgi:hypothetical protein